jgi:hypothetical protein
MKLHLTAVVLLALGFARGASAQQTQIPASERPPAGMCRIWLDGVPAAQQPAPTDCATAVKNRPEKGRVLFGDDYVAPRTDSARKPMPAISGFAPSKTPPKTAPRIVTPPPTRPRRPQ